jgi:hypothetical protein
MAVTAHWIQKVTICSSDTPQHVLKLRADLVGFLRVPGRHTGSHLAIAFLYVLDRLDITKKVGGVSYYI